MGSSGVTVFGDVNSTWSGSEGIPIIIDNNYIGMANTTRGLVWFLRNYYKYFDVIGIEGLTKVYILPEENWRKKIDHIKVYAIDNWYVKDRTEYYGYYTYYEYSFTRYQYIYKTPARAVQ